MITGLSPMAGYTDYWFRQLCRKRGAQLTVTEMASAEALIRGNEQAKGMLKADAGEVSQLFGNNPDSLERACFFVETDWIELNAGCPANVIIGSGGGSALLKDLPLLKKCVSALAEKKKASVKIRLGWKKDDSVAIARACEEAGATRIVVHGRTQDQAFSGKADWNAIARVKESVGIEVLGNGDVVSVADGVAKAESASCDGFLVGRAAAGHPGFFDGTDNRKKDFLEYAKQQGDFNNLKIQAFAFCKGFENARELRNSISRAKGKAELVSLFETL